MENSVNNNNNNFNFVYIFVKFYYLFSCELLTYLNSKDLINFAKASKSFYYKILNDNELWTKLINLDVNLERKFSSRQTYLDILLSVKKLSIVNKYLSYSLKKYKNPKNLNLVHEFIENINLTYCDSYYFVCLNKLSSFYVLDAFYAALFVKKNIYDIFNLIHFVVLDGYEYCLTESSFGQFLLQYIDRLQDKLDMIHTDHHTLFMGFYGFNFSILFSNINFNYPRLPCSYNRRSTIQYNAVSNNLISYFRRMKISNTEYLNINLLLNTRVNYYHNYVNLTIFHPFEQYRAESYIVHKIYHHQDDINNSYKYEYLDNSVALHELINPQISRPENYDILSRFNIQALL